MPSTKYDGSYIKGNLGGTKVSNPSSVQYYGKMIDAPGFAKGVQLEKPLKVLELITDLLNLVQE